MVDILFRKKTFKLMNYYNDKKFNKENSVGFCSVTKKNFIKLPRKTRKSYQKPKKLCK